MFLAYRYQVVQEFNKGYMIISLEQMKVMLMMSTIRRKKTKRASVRSRRNGKMNVRPI